MTPRADDDTEGSDGSGDPAGPEDDAAIDDEDGSGDTTHERTDAG